MEFLEKPKAHKKKIKTFGVIVSFVLLCVGIYYLSYNLVLNNTKSEACRGMFDSKSNENQKRICCDPNHYNNQDEMCRVKCDFLNISPNSSFCLDLSTNQETLGVSDERVKPEKLDPKCTSIEVDSTEVLDGGQRVVRPESPLKAKYTFMSPDYKAKKYLIEFFSYKDDLKDLKPIQFEKEKTFNIFYQDTNQKKDISKPNLQTLEFSLTHEDFYKPDLSQDSSYPNNVLMVVSTFDENNKKVLQSQDCYVKLYVDNSPSYCKSFKASNDELELGGKINFELTPSISNVFGYKLKFQNLENNNQDISFSYLNNQKQPFLTQDIPARNQEKFSSEFSWTDFYRPDLNNNKIPKKVRALAYVLPKADSEMKNLAPCITEFKVKPDPGIEMCKNLTFWIKNKNTGAQKTKETNQDYNLLTSNDLLYLKSESNINSNEFTYTFHNLNNITEKDYGKGKGYTKEGVKNANEISFDTSQDFSISKIGGDGKSSTIEVDYSQFNRIDLNTSKKPKSIQVRAFFKNEGDRTSKLDPDCVIDFRVE
jgi:hypothetical protein